MSSDGPFLPKKKILVKVPKFVGDIVMVLPALNALSYAFPEETHEMHLLMRKAFVPLLDTPGCRWKFIEDPTERPEKGSLWRRVRALGRRERQHAIERLLERHGHGRKDPFTASVTFTREVDYQRAFSRVGIPARFGWDQIELVCLGRVNRPVEPITRISDPGQIDQVKYFMKMAEAVFVNETGKPWPPATISPLPRLEVCDEFIAKKATEAFCKLSNSSQGLRDVTTSAEGIDNFFTVVTTTSQGSSIKRWPLERFLEVSLAVARDRGWTPLFSFGPGDEAAYQALVAAPLWNTLVNQFRAIGVPPGDIDLQQFMALLARSRFVLTNDTGPRHVALALGTRTVTIFGPSPPGRAVHAPHLERAIKLHDDCKATCNVKKNRCRYGNVCLALEAVTPRLVNEHIRDFLDAV